MSKIILFKIDITKNGIPLASISQKNPEIPPSIAINRTEIVIRSIKVKKKFKKNSLVTISKLS
ncbi:hypothetical protein WFZ85_14425 [Flavobacterium sp. j3]|uniref:Uncharacterized protein n=1 Tax=Flavobacterium aureirubrum TaxID=3133147 RepID=A0ABU9N809_9FLAO